MPRWAIVTLGSPHSVRPDIPRRGRWWLLHTYTRTYMRAWTRQAWNRCSTVGVGSVWHEEPCHPSSRGVRNSTLIVGAANSARNYPDARHLLGSCRPVGVPTGRTTEPWNGARGLFARRVGAAERLYECHVPRMSSSWRTGALPFARREIGEAISRDNGTDNTSWGPSCCNVVRCATPKLGNWDWRNHKVWLSRSNCDANPIYDAYHTGNNAIGDGVKPKRPLPSRMIYAADYARAARRLNLITEIHRHTRERSNACVGSRGRNTADRNKEI